MDMIAVLDGGMAASFPMLMRLVVAMGMFAGRH
jgi:hypothetical protein